MHRVIMLIHDLCSGDLVSPCLKRFSPRFIGSPNASVLVFVLKTPDSLKPQGRTSVILLIPIRLWSAGLLSGFPTLSCRSLRHARTSSQVAPMQRSRWAIATKSASRHRQCTLGHNPYCAMRRAQTQKCENNAMYFGLSFGFPIDT